jgi:hypothetical protein
MRDRPSDERLITTGGVAVLAASLALVAYWVPMAVDIMGGNPQSALEGLLWLALLAAVAVPGGLGVWAAWRRRPLVAWVVASLFVTVWVWRQLPPIVAVVPVLSLAAAVLVTLTTRRAARI